MVGELRRLFLNASLYFLFLTIQAAGVLTAIKALLRLSTA
jgi:hypothetical protein